MKIFKFKKAMPAGRRGFTLIELLVVISVMAVLIVAAISSINPVEQRNKAIDTGSKSDASEYLNALERYYATFGCYPWDNGNNGGATSNPCPATPIGLAVGAIGSLDTTTTNELISKNEMKSQFQDRVKNQTTADAKNVLMVSDPDTDTNLVHVCFKPSSKTFGAQATSNNDGTTGTGFVCVP